MSDKAYAVEQAVGNLVPGPWTPFNPLNAGWAITSTTGVTGYALARYCPADNSVELLFSVFVTAGITAGQAADGYGWANMPATDTAGNDLTPVQTGYCPVMTDCLQTGATPQVPRVHVNSGGAMTLFGISTSATFMRCHQWYTMDDLGLS